MNYVTAKNITIRLGGIEIIKNASFTIDSSSFIGIIGPNGGGKSTLIKAILGLNPIASGALDIKLSHEEIGYLPQVNQQMDKNFPISVREVIRSGALQKRTLIKPFSKSDNSRVNTLIEQFDLKALAKKPIGRLSGGEMQRCFLARSLMGQPKLLILDEPTNFIDEPAQEKLYKLLTEISKHTAIVMVSHDLSVIPQYIKSIICVNKTVHVHEDNKISSEILANYASCPVELITHGTVPHRVLKIHEKGKQ